MLVNTITRFNRAMGDESKQNPFSVGLTYDVAAPGTATQAKSYGVAGLGTLAQAFTDLTSGNISAVPGDIISGITSFDLPTIAFVGLIGFLALGGFKGGRSASRAKSRRAAIKGAIARDQALLS